MVKINFFSLVSTLIEIGIPKICKIHPLSCLDNDSLNTNDINDLNIQFTPWDSFSVWKSLENHKSIYTETDPEIILKIKKG